MLKRFSLLILSFTFLLNGYSHEPDPVEGMWIPLLLKQFNVADMKAAGLKLSAEDLYSVNKSSLKDAIVSFGGFCTGEVVSDQGLLFTNHHCGFSAIQSHSSPEKDYLKEGFWAMSQEEELPNEGLTATFIVRIEDVTQAVLEGVEEGMNEAARQMMINSNIATVETKSVEGTHYDARIKPFFYGNEFYMFVTETFKDVRMVGAPPEAIGKYGADTDNWMWPRHTGDFSVFRIYAGPDNKPAEYSLDNKPYKPKHFLPISLKGVEKDDFTMVYGFPGRTSEYLSSYAVAQTVELNNPNRIELREQVIDIYNRYMGTSTAVRIQYASKQARLANYWKKWIGENRGLARLDAINKKKEMEADFQTWADQNPKRKEKYGSILEEFRKEYEKMGPLSLSQDYLNEAAFRSEIILFAYRWTSLVAKSEAGTEEDVKAEVEKLKKRAEGHFKDYHQPIDREVFELMMKAYYKNIDKSMHPDIFQTISGKFKGDFSAFADYVFKKSFMTSREKTDAFLDSYSSKKVKKILKDPAYQVMSSVLNHYRDEVRGPLVEIQDKIDRLSRDYVAGLREMSPDKNFYPDANSTLRITYGKVDNYDPADGVHYKHISFMEGIMEKYIPGDREFDLPQKLIDLYEKKDFGQYGQNGKMPVCFTASNHTTGGNSGSPVINGEGHLIGTNFDRNWEGTMSDIMYDPDMCRNISVDVRYILFVIDKYAGAGHLIKEMKLIK